MVTRRHVLKIGGLSVLLFGFVREFFSQTTGQAPAKLVSMTAGLKALGPEDYEVRLEKAGRLMADSKMDGLVLTGGANLVYFTAVNWARSERTFAAILNRKGKPIWVCPSFELERAKELIPTSEEIRVWEEHESPYRLVGQVMGDLGVRAGRLGIDPSASAFQIFGLRQIKKSLSWTSPTRSQSSPIARDSRTSKKG
jgi:Xaa-Pro dipeptidase